MSDEKEKQWQDEADRSWCDRGDNVDAYSYAEGYLAGRKAGEEECDRLRANHEEFARKMGDEIHVRNNHVRELKASNEQLRAENEQLEYFKMCADEFNRQCKYFQSEIHRLKDLVKRAKEHIEKGYFEDHNDWYKWIKDSEVIGE